MRWSWKLVAALGVLGPAVLGACSSEQDESAAVSASVASSLSVDSTVALRQVDVDGALVRFYGTSDELVDQAAVVQYTSLS